MSILDIFIAEVLQSLRTYVSESALSTINAAFRKIRTAHVGLIFMQAVMSLFMLSTVLVLSVGTYILINAGIVQSVVYFFLWASTCTMIIFGAASWYFLIYKHPFKEIRRRAVEPLMLQLEQLTQNVKERSQSELNSERIERLEKSLLSLIEVIEKQNKEDLLHKKNTRDPFSKSI